MSWRTAAGRGTFATDYAPRQSRMLAGDARDSAHAEPPSNHVSGCRPPRAVSPAVAAHPRKGTPPYHRAGRTNILSP